ncbi:MAG: general secretion pathway protein GspK [Candidatus Omnitrophica bacterium]|nr:general secretion pathway protein GspK [Candidatus Omnitrophota bacterium]
MAKEKYYKKQDQKGVALILAIGILAILAILATSFSLNSRLEYHAAVNYRDLVKARYIAEAGIAKAIVDLKANANMNFVDDALEAWHSGYINQAMGAAYPYSGYKYTTTIVDCGRLINIENTANGQLSVILNNLGTIVGTSDGTIGNTITGGGPYFTVEDLKKVITKDDFDKIKDFVTVHGYIDPNTNRSPININTAPEEVLKALLIGLNDTIDKEKANTIVTIVTDDESAINANRPFRGWDEFDTAIGKMELAEIISSGEADAIKNNFNPNRQKPVNYTTEFSFNSGGYYHITSTGVIERKNGVKVAEATVEAVVKIFDIWTQTTATQFENSVSSNYRNVTWLDSCPVRSDQNWGAPGYDIIANSLKLGYWDDFDPDPAHAHDAYSEAAWEFDGDTGNDIAGSIVLAQGKKAKLDDTHWKFGDYSLTLHESEIETEGEYGAIRLRESESDSEVHLELVSTAPTRVVELKSPVTDTAEAFYYPNKYYRAVLDSSQVDTYYHIYLVDSSSGDTTSLVVPKHSGQASGWSADTIRLESKDDITTTWDNIRIIPETGYYISDTTDLTDPALNPYSDSGVVEWGSIHYTVTIPDTASGASETVLLQTKTGGPWSADLASNDAIPDTNSASIQYRANFQTADNAANVTPQMPYYSETPVLEDVTITYLDKTSILYWRQR